MPAPRVILIIDLAENDLIIYDLVIEDEKELTWLRTYHVQNVDQSLTAWLINHQHSIVHQRSDPTKNTPPIDLGTGSLVMHDRSLKFVTRGEIIVITGLLESEHT